jgi:hypothetical protein
MANFNMILKNANAVFFGIQMREDIATTRAINILGNRALNALVKEISLTYGGIPKRSIKSRIKFIRATRLNKLVRFVARSTRMTLVKPKQLKRGISHIKKGKGRRRTKVIDRQKGGSRPFLIRAKMGGVKGGDDINVGTGVKMIPVYRPKGSRRKVRTMQGSSVAHMLEQVGVDDNFLGAFILKNFPEEYRKQLNKAKFV